MKSGRNLPKQTGPGTALGGSLSSSFPTCPDTCRHTRVLRPTGLRVCVCPGHTSLVPPGLGRLESSPPRGRASSRMRLETFQQHRFHDPGLPWRRRRQGGALSRPPGSPRLGCICPGRFRKGSAPPSVAAGLSCLPPRTRGTEGPPRPASGRGGRLGPSFPRSLLFGAFSNSTVARFSQCGSRLRSPLLRGFWSLLDAQASRSWR